MQEIDRRRKSLIERIAELSSEDLERAYWEMVVQGLLPPPEEKNT